MKSASYQIMATTSRWLGLWVLSLGARLIAAWYFLFKPSQLVHSLRLYRALYPDRGKCFHWSRAWKQYQNFTTVFVDRQKALEDHDIPCRVRGEGYLEEALHGGRGAILLMSHVGNWEAAAHLLSKGGLELMLYMGEQQGEQIESLQKRDLRRSGVRVVKIVAGGGSPLDGLTALNHLRRGGTVSLAGDRIWAGERRVPVEFLGRRVELPAAPHVLAMVSGAPLLTFFVFRLQEGGYRVEMMEPYWVKALSRADRERAVAQSVQHYARNLEDAVRRHPTQWYTFEPFLGAPWDDGESRSLKN